MRLQNPIGLPWYLYLCPPPHNTKTQSHTRVFPSLTRIIDPKIFHQKVRDRDGKRMDGWLWSDKITYSPSTSHSAIGLSRRVFVCRTTMRAFSGTTERKWWHLWYSVLAERLRLLIISNLIWESRLLAFIMSCLLAYEQWRLNLQSNDTQTVVGLGTSFSRTVKLLDISGDKSLTG